MPIPWGGTNGVAETLRQWVVQKSGFADDHVIWARENAGRPIGTFIVLDLVEIRRVGQDWVTTKLNVLALASTPVVGFLPPSQLTAPGHLLLTADGAVRLDNTGTLPLGLATHTDYWAVKLGPNAVGLARSFLDAIASPPVLVTFTGASTGTTAIVTTTSTVRQGQEVLRTATGNRSCRLELTCYAGISGDTTTVQARAVPMNELATLEAVLYGARLPRQQRAFQTAGIGVYDFGHVRALGGNVSWSVFEPRAVAEIGFYVTNEVEEFGTFIERVVLTDQVSDPPVEFTVSDTDK